uniref:C2H2-type domain-containing protein n=1 Tax=Acrobeloides nanus TaxID=290746 RepID=A0A914CX10_9BILA
MADLSMHLAETDVPTSRSDDGTTSEQSLSNNYEPIIFRQIVPNRLFLSTDVSGPNSLLQPLNLVGFENYTGFIGGGQTPAFPLDFSSNFNNSTHAQMVARNSAKTLKCPKCNWNYKYQDTLESHMREKHPDIEITCVYCLQNRPHPKLARGETYSCGYKPYRCELCGYSTTTKGNLSIHMQSDKHLHAMQEMPNSMIVSSPIHPTEVGDEKSLHCMICTNFSTNNADDMVDHLENDRSRTCPNDITFSHGTYQCRLCPYNTNLKANFQLHMRTDKHIQRVQLVNHMREGSSTAGIAPGALVCRLSAVKSLIQVRCRPCQEVLTCTKAIREHCESRTHQSRIAFMQVNATNISRQSSTTPSEINTTQTEFDLYNLRRHHQKLTQLKQNSIFVMNANFVDMKLMIR